MGVYSLAKSSEKGIQGLLSQAAIQYISLIELGNLFLGDPNWRERYRRLVTLAGDVLIERLRQVPEPFCLMCAEQKVVDCHRQVIAEYLAENGWEVEHIE
jgi:uncharacterized protein (DUF488 family)